MATMFTELCRGERIPVPVLFKMYDAACSYWMAGNTRWRGRAAPAARGSVGCGEGMPGDGGQYRPVDSAPDRIGH
jgi:hypothetical protein